MPEKKIRIESFQNFQSIKYSKKYTWLTEYKTMKDINKVPKYNSTVATRFWSKEFFIQNCIKLHFLTKCDSLTRHLASLSLLYFNS